MLHWILTLTLAGPGPVDPGPIDIEAGRQHWSFQALGRPIPPVARDHGWPRGPIDLFVLAQLEENGVRPAMEADRSALLRRVSLDLVGLPPGVEEIRAFERDRSPQAFERVVDRLLGSPLFGERWGRHWLDVARYAESSGSTRNLAYPLAWRYRDHVIDAFNADKPMDRFIHEQIAGDLLPATSDAERHEQLVATAFLALGAHDFNQTDPRAFRMDIIAEQIDTLGRTFLGLTIACARCHDHKLAPIPTADYYALAGIFESTDTLVGLNHKRSKSGMVRGDYLALLDGTLAAVAARNLLSEENDRLGAEKYRLKDIEADLEAEIPVEGWTVESVKKRIGEVSHKQTAVSQEFVAAYSVAMGVRERARVVNSSINIQGDPHRLGDEIPRGFLQVLRAPESEAVKFSEHESGRAQLARWLTRPENPLAARVFVNRVWHHLLGRGIVRTVDDFGPTGELPTHPQLLDWLTREFIETGWSTKHLIRNIVLSRAYAQATSTTPEDRARDPQNKLLGRAHLRRLEFEVLRDATLHVSGVLDHRRPEGSLAAHSIGASLSKAEDAMKDPAALFGSGYRTVYLPVVRGFLHSAFRIFDFVPPAHGQGARDVTTVPSQALFFMNSAFVAQQALLAAETLLREETSPTARVRQVFLQTLGRQPSADEHGLTLEYVEALVLEGVAETEAWADVYHARIASAEFRHRN